jgi:hypothetical protein
MGTYQFGRFERRRLSRRQLRGRQDLQPRSDGELEKLGAGIND